jgi:predicted GTPase
MPYGDLAAQRVQRFATLADLEANRCTIEEREEYEPHLEIGNVVFAGVDYAAIMAAAQAEADLLIWDGGNNDFPFLTPDLHIVIVDALRPGNVDSHHPGETTVRLADVVVVNKVNTAPAADAERAAQTAKRLNPKARLVWANSPVTLADPSAVRGKRVLVIEDGPTLTHGGMQYGAGYVAAQEAGAAEIIDPRSAAVPVIAAVYRQYPHLSQILPAVGYGEEQLAALGETIRRVACDVVVSATPIDLSARVQSDKPIVRARYEYADAGEPTLGSIVDEFIAARLRAHA